MDEAFHKPYTGEMNRYIMGTLIFSFIVLAIAFRYSSSQRTIIYDLNTSLTEATLRTDSDKIKEKVSSMTPEEKIGQLFLIGTFENGSTEVLKNFIKKKHIGSVILLNPNLKNQNVIDVTTELQDARQDRTIPLFISVDQEGGIVSRIKDNDSNLASQASIGDDTQAYTLANERGKELKRKGVNVNFSPVLDFIENSKSFLSKRVFNGSKDDYLTRGSFMVHGYEDAGIIAVIKHFPGHDDSSVDSHKNLPVSNISENEFDSYTSVFKDVIATANPGMVMTAHVLFPKIDPVYPATLSKKIISKLRDDYHYDGIIITDDLNMGAIAKNFGVEKSALLAFDAGNDLLLYVATSTNIEKAYIAVLNAYKAGKISEERVIGSVERILRAKEKMK